MKDLVNMVQSGSIKQMEYEVEAGSGPVIILQLRIKDYLSLTEEYRKARHVRITKFL